MSATRVTLYEGGEVVVAPRAGERRKVDIDMYEGTRHMYGRAVDPERAREFGQALIDAADQIAPLPQGSANGVWAHADHNEVYSVYGEEIEALRAAVRAGYGEARWLTFGESV